MKIIFFECSEFEGDQKEWSLSEASLGGINLIVGKNASGKTRALNVLNGLAQLLSGSRRELFVSGTYKVIFETDRDKKKYLYELVLKDKNVIKELFKVSRKVVLKRDGTGKGIIYADQLKQDMKIKSPTNELAVVSRRDVIQHPYLEDIYNWAKSVKLYSFGSPLGKDTVAVLQSGVGADEEFTTNPRRVVELFKTGLAEYGESFSDKILNDFNSIGYDCEEVGLMTSDDIHVRGTPAAVLFVKEKDLKRETNQLGMSQGMFRALSLIVQMNYSLLSNKHTCILIDDIGEGLDFERSTELIKLIITMVETSSFQLVMTSNDRFVMNNVSLKYWSVIKRSGHKVNIINKQNSEEYFKEFEYMGMSNFDFFASEFFLGKFDD